MSNDLPILDAADCQLLPADKIPLVERYNSLVSKLSALRGEAEGLSGFPERISEFQNFLASAHARLCRKYFRVGFLGTTGAGKSTTFNNILRASEDPPAKEGGGTATTAAPARLRRSAAGKTDVKLHYMNEMEYQRRRRRLASHLKLGEILTEDDILRQCEDLRTRLNRGDFIQGIVLDDVIALESLLLSKKKFNNLILSGSNRQITSGNYSERDKYLNHPFSASQKHPQPIPSQNRLLWEVVIEFSNDVLPLSLEMIDLPGLGATSYHDTCVTLDLVECTDEEGLDGALIFIRSEQLSDDSVVQIIQHLQGAWGRRFKGRVWAVFTKFDTLTESHYTNTPNFFSSVDKLLRESDIPNDCVFVVSNEVAKKLTGDLQESERIKKSGAKLVYEWENPVLLQQFEKYPYFKNVIHEVYLNGGLDSLRTAIVERLSQMIGREVAEDVDCILSQVDQGIEFAIKTAQRRKVQSSQDQENATKCAKVLNRLIQNIRRGTSEFRTATLKIRDGMQETVAKFSPVDDLAEMPPQDILSNFIMLTNRLDQTTQHHLVNHVVEPIYTSIQNYLRDLPSLPLGKAETIQQAWGNLVQFDSETKNWIDEIPRFQEKELIEQMCSAADPLQGVQFKAILDNKIHAVTLVTMFRVRERVLFRLSDFANELKLLVTGQ